MAVEPEHCSTKDNKAVQQSSPVYETKDNRTVQQSSPSYETKDNRSVEQSIPVCETKDNRTVEQSSPSYETKDNMSVEQSLSVYETKDNRGVQQSSPYHETKDNRSGQQSLHNTINNNKNNNISDNIGNRPEDNVGTLDLRKPTVEQVRTYCALRNNGIDPERFWNYYECLGWMIAGSPMRDWMAVIRHWEKREQYKPKPQRQERGFGGYTDEDFDEMQRFISQGR